jgi:hypothetical protein
MACAFSSGSSRRKNNSLQIFSDLTLSVYVIKLVRLVRGIILFEHLFPPSSFTAFPAPLGHIYLENSARASGSYSGGPQFKSLPRDRIF